MNDDNNTYWHTLSKDELFIVLFETFKDLEDKQNYINKLEKRYETLKRLYLKLKDNK